MKNWIYVVVAAAVLSGCQSTYEERGALLGATAGGILGNQIGGGSGKVFATMAGAAIGAVAGAAVGAKMDEVDRMKMAQAYQSSLEYNRSGQQTEWVNPDSGNRGSFEPTRTYQNSVGQYCREYQQTITVAGRTEQGYGTACRQPDGSWQILGGY